MIRILLLIVLFGYTPVIPAGASEYAVAHAPAPVLNDPDFKAVFGGTTGRILKTDRCGQVRELEYIAMPGSVFRILGKRRSGASLIYQVETDEYPAPPNVRLFVDSRFLKLERTAPAPRTALLPPREQIVSALRASAGSPYVWGGNVSAGVPGPPAWIGEDVVGAGNMPRLLAGLDCSGLLYQATGGLTPRNTSQLTAFGQGVAIAGKPSAEIAALLQPLDLIVWNGHVIMVLDRQTAIESRLECGKPGNGGVVMSGLAQRLAAVMRERRPADIWPAGKTSRDIFVVRRWYDTAKALSDKKSPRTKKTIDLHEIVGYKTHPSSLHWA